MSLPTNAEFSLQRDVPAGNEDGTPIYERRRFGPYRCWLRPLAPDVVDEGALAVYTRGLVKMYYVEGVGLDQADRIEVTIDEEDVAVSYEVETTRARTSPVGVHHIEVVLKVVVEGR